MMTLWTKLRLTRRQQAFSRSLSTNNFFKWSRASFLSSMTTRYLWLTLKSPSRRTLRWLTKSSRRPRTRRLSWCTWRIRLNLRRESLRESTSLCRLPSHRNALRTSKRFLWTARGDVKSSWTASASSWRTIKAFKGRVSQKKRYWTYLSIYSASSWRMRSPSTWSMSSWRRSL